MTMIGLIERAWEIEAEPTIDGRTVLLRIVPYGRPTMVRDYRRDGTVSGPYEEEWEKGAFRHVAKAPHRVPLIVGRHEDRENPWDDIGRAELLEERDDALYGAFPIDESPFGDHALNKIRTKQWRGVSVGARDIKHRMDGSKIVRTLAHLDHVLITERAQVPGAEILTLRSGQPDSRLLRWLRKYPLKAGG
jgi:phage head maturation protease